MQYHPQDLKHAFEWDSWSMGENGIFGPTDKSEYHDRNELMDAYSAALIDEEMERRVANGEFEVVEKVGKKRTWRRIRAVQESDDGR